MANIANTQENNSLTIVVKIILLCTVFTVSTSQTMDIGFEIAFDRYDQRKLMVQRFEQNQIDSFNQLLAQEKDFGTFFIFAMNSENTTALVHYLLNTEDFARNAHSFLSILCHATDQKVPLEILHSVIKKAKALGWDIDQVKQLQHTPLGSAIEHGNRSAVQLLIDEGCRALSPALYTSFGLMNRGQSMESIDKSKECLRLLLQNRLTDLDNSFVLRLVVFTDLIDQIPALIFDGAEYDRTWAKDDAPSQHSRFTIEQAEKDYCERQLILLTDNTPLPIPLLTIIHDYIKPPDTEYEAMAAPMDLSDDTIEEDDTCE